MLLLSAFVWCWCWYGRKQSLTVIDNRTGKSVEIPIKDNSVPATAFKQLKADPEKNERKENETEGGLRVLDPAYMNTATIYSRITYINGEEGILRYRGEECALMLYPWLMTRLRHSRPRWQVFLSRGCISPHLWRSPYKVSGQIVWIRSHASYISSIRCFRAHSKLSLWCSSNEYLDLGNCRIVLVQSRG